MRMSHICYLRHRDLRKPLEFGIERVDSLAFVGSRDLARGLDLCDHRLDLRSVAVSDLLVPRGERRLARSKMMTYL
jgi:hypothetical protein